MRRKQKGADNQLIVADQNVDVSYPVETTEKDYIDLARHTVDGAVAISNMISGAVSTVAAAQASIEKSRADAAVQIAEINKEVKTTITEEENIHDEVMSNLQNMSAVINHITGTPGLSDNPEVIMSLIASIERSSMNSVEMRKTKSNRKK